MPLELEAGWMVTVTATFTVGAAVDDAEVGPIVAGAAVVGAAFVGAAFVGATVVGATVVGGVVENVGTDVGLGVGLTPSRPYEQEKGGGCGRTPQ